MNAMYPIDHAWQRSHNVEQKDRFSPSFVITDSAAGQMLRVVYYGKETRTYDRYGNA